jgi:DHA1 family inner membrane transport protein
MFSMYSYIAPTITHVTGLSRTIVPVFLLAFGVGGSLGTVLAGRLADWSVMRSMVLGSFGMGGALAVFTLTAHQPVGAFLTVLAVAALGSILVVTLQMRLMQVAGDAQTLGAAMNHASLNAANALGAWLGGLVIAAGYGYTAPSWVGAALSLAGLGVLAVSVALHRRDLAAMRRKVDDCYPVTYSDTSMS